MSIFRLAGTAAGVALILGIGGCATDPSTAANLSYSRFETLCGENRLFEAAVEYQYANANAFWAYEQARKEGRADYIPTNLPKEPLLNKLREPENIDHLVYLVEESVMFPQLAVDFSVKLADALGWPGNAKGEELLSYYRQNKHRLAWDANDRAFRLQVNIPAGRKLPAGFEPAEGSGLSPDGYPLRIICLKDGSEMVYVPKGKLIEFTPQAAFPTPIIGHFYVDKYETTNALYSKFCKETGHREPNFDTRGTRWAAPKDLSGLDDPQQPVTCILFKDAMAYAKWAGKSIPTEEEWKRAAFGDFAYWGIYIRDISLPSRMMPWLEAAGSSNQMTTDANGRNHWALDQYAILDRPFVEKGGRPEKVGGRPKGASVWGAEDMLGNVKEYAIPTLIKNSVSAMGGCFTWEWGRYDLDTYDYSSADEVHYDAEIGFRCVLALPDN